LTSSFIDFNFIIEKIKSDRGINWSELYE